MSKGVEGNRKGCRYINKRGYVIVNCPGHPQGNYVLEHRLVMEKHLGRYLSEAEIVHHINGEKQDNRIENLMLFSDSKEHIKYHKQQKGRMNPVESGHKGGVATRDNAGRMGGRGNKRILITTKEGTCGLNESKR